MNTLPTLRRAARAASLFAALALGGGAVSAAPPPRLWEAVKPADPSVRIYILAAGAQGNEGYFDRVVMPAFTQAHVLHRDVPVGFATGGSQCAVSQIHTVDVDTANGARFPSCLASDRAALLRAAHTSTTSTDNCARTAAWIGEFDRMDDGLTHFVIADVAHGDADCKGLLGRLTEAGYVLWPVAEFRTEQAAAW